MSRLKRNKSQYVTSTDDTMGNPYRVGREVMDLKKRDGDNWLFYSYGVETVEDYISAKKTKLVNDGKRFVIKNRGFFRRKPMTIDQLKRIGYEKLPRDLFPPSTSSPNRRGEKFENIEMKYKTWIQGGGISCDY